MQKPRQSQALPPPRGSGIASTASSRSNVAGSARLLAKAPARWKAPVAKLLGAKAIAGSALPDDRPPDPDEPVKKSREVLRWHVGSIYAGFGLLDLLARVIGRLLWGLRHNTNDMPRVSDTQRADLTGPVLYSDLMRLVFVGSAAAIRCILNLVVLWHVMEHLRPSWKNRVMRHLCPVFKILLLLWVFGDGMQACIPNVPPDPAEHRITTPHIFFHQLGMIASGLANCVLLVVFFHDRDAGDVSVIAGVWTLVVMALSFIYYDIALFRGQSGRSTPMGWALVVETCALMFNVGNAIPPRIIAVPGELERKLPKFLREGKVRANEDTSARTGSKPLLLSGPEMPDIEPPRSEIHLAAEGNAAAPGANVAPKQKSKSSYAAQRKKPKTEDEILQRQRAELAALNAQLRSVQAADLAPVTASISSAVASVEAPQAAPAPLAQSPSALDSYAP